MVRDTDLIALDSFASANPTDKAFNFSVSILQNGNSLESSVILNGKFISSYLKDILKPEIADSEETGIEWNHKQKREDIIAAFDATAEN